MNADLLQDILNDMRVELVDEFDRNFVRGSFFGKTWQQRIDGSASTLQDTGKLRRSIRARVQNSSVVFSSSEPYAAIHNEGGEITVTAKMRRFFWAKYYEAGKTTEKARTYKALALKKVGDTIKIPQRQYIGDHPQIRSSIEAIVKENIDRQATQITRRFNDRNT